MSGLADVALELSIEKLFDVLDLLEDYEGFNLAEARKGIDKAMGHLIAEADGPG